jgi:hypothetical protein
MDTARYPIKFMVVKSFVNGEILSLKKQSRKFMYLGDNNAKTKKDYGKI